MRTRQGDILHLRVCQNTLVQDANNLAFCISLPLTSPNRHGTTSEHGSLHLANMVSREPEKMG